MEYYDYLSSIENFYLCRLCIIQYCILIAIWHGRNRVPTHVYRVTSMTRRFSRGSLTRTCISGRLVCVHHAIVNKDTDVTLTLEHQSRESGAIMDSVSKKHRLLQDLHRMQHCVAPSGELTILFQLRESLMTFMVMTPNQFQHKEHKDKAVDLNLDAPWDPTDHSDDPTQTFEC